MSETPFSAASSEGPSSSPAAQPRRAALAFIFVTVVLDVLALGIVIPVLPKLVEGFLKGDTAQAARIFGIFGTVWALMQFVFSPVIGALSDRFGRRPIVLMSNFGLGLDYILMALAPTLGWLLVGRVISGITAASFATAGAYVADVTPQEKRASGFGMVGAAWGLGFVLGPALGGILGDVNPRLPFWVAGALSLLNGLYGLFVLPESLPLDQRKPWAWRRANPIGVLVHYAKDRVLRGLFSVAFLHQLAHGVLPSCFVLYTSYRYGWGERTVGLTLAAVGVCGIVVQGALVRIIVSRIGERRALIAGLLFGVAGYIIYGLSRSGLEFWSGAPIFAMMGLFGPATQGLMSRRVSPKEQGQLQGAGSSLIGITGLIGPSLFTMTFAYFLVPRGGVYLVGAPFLLAGLLVLIAVPLALYVTSPRYLNAPEPRRD
jgi:DHA1 family tetracycline resistance protein-like MFS transporter